MFKLICKYLMVFVLTASLSTPSIAMLPQHDEEAAEAPTFWIVFQKRLPSISYFVYKCILDVNTLLLGWYQVSETRELLKLIDQIDHSHCSGRCADQANILKHLSDQAYFADEILMPLSAYAAAADVIGIVSACVDNNKAMRFALRTTGCASTISMTASIVACSGLKEGNFLYSLQTPYEVAMKISHMASDTSIILGNTLTNGISGILVMIWDYYGNG